MSQSSNPQLRLDASIPANNYKIIEIYNKVRKEEWDVQPAFQRKLVWKKQHKINFIETILLNYPFPEIYIAPGKMDSVNLTYCDVVVDGQQRTTTLINYIEGKDVFAQKLSKIKAFKDLTEDERRNFLNFEVSIRYLKNANQEQIKNIFQRINSSEYSLNQIEKHNAQYGDSEFMLFAKQITEENLDQEIIEHRLTKSNRDILHNFFVINSKIFNTNDLDRMLALQYIMTLLATMIDKGEYFHRTQKIEEYIEKFNGEFPDAYIYESSLVNIIKTIDSLELDSNSIWFTKANMFTLIIELYRLVISEKDKGLEDINISTLKNTLEKFEKSYHKYLLDKENYQENQQGEILYFEGSRQGLNDIGPRKNRGKLMEEFIQQSLV